MRTEEFFATARERYKIRERRLAGQKWPWTKDPVFKCWRFCNVHREHDKTTVWFRDNIRARTEGLKAIEATFIFRWFNRIETAEIIKDLILYKWNSAEARRRLKDQHPVVTGAYMLKTPDGKTKLDGVIYCITKGLPMLKDIKLVSIEDTVTKLDELPFVGPFMAYEIASDLRWTNVLDKAPDIMTWANPGPGCARGLTWVIGKDGLDRDVRFRRNHPVDREEMLDLMRELLAKAPEHWPSEYQPWEMREVEHWACEFDKYMRAQSGRRLKRSYRH